MRLIIKQGDRVINEFQFAEGPVTIGRQPSCKVVLANGTVSKKHAVISSDGSENWFIEDMKSSNGTYLNDKSIQKKELKTGDQIRISDFNIEIDLKDKSDTAAPAQLEDTLDLQASLTTQKHETVVRKPDAAHAPAMRLEARRLTDFSQATETLSKVRDLDEFLQSTINIILKQFSALRTWCALRDQPGGPMMFHVGKRRDGKKVELDDLILKDKIDQAVERGQSLVLPSVSAQVEKKERIRSALIATIMRPSGCYGVLYVDNAMIHKHYSLSDLDYLMFLAIHISSVLKNV